LLGFLAQMPQLGMAIWLVNLINGAFSFWQEYKAEQATTALRRLLPTYARVLRDGQEQRLLGEALVPGDVMLLAEGTTFRPTVDWCKQRNCVWISRPSRAKRIPCANRQTPSCSAT